MDTLILLTEARLTSVDFSLPLYYSYVRNSSIILALDPNGAIEQENASEIFI